MIISDNMKEYLKKIGEKYKTENEVMNFMYNFMFNRMMNIHYFPQVIPMAKGDNFLKGAIESFPVERLRNNDYYRNIKMPNVSKNGYTLSDDNIFPRMQIHMFDEPTYDVDKMQLKPKLFTCNCDINCPMILENEPDMVWMSVEPLEINSFDEIIKEAKGNVLLLGLGLGYAAYMISQKEDVQSVTVVELDKNVIDLFNSYLLCQFPNKDKIKIVNADGIEYLRNNDLNQFDYVNLDIWMNVEDMLPTYLKALPIDYSYPNVKFSYWCEKSLKTRIQESIIYVVSGQTTRICEFDEVVKSLLKDAVIDSEESFKEILRLDNFRDRMHEISGNSFSTLITELPEYYRLLKQFK